MRVSGTVTYKDEFGKRRSIPYGECEVDETSVSVILSWKDHLGNECQSTLSDSDFAQYKQNNALLPL